MGLRQAGEAGGLGHADLIGKIILEISLGPSQSPDGQAARWTRRIIVRRRYCFGRSLLGRGLTPGRRPRRRHARGRGIDRPFHFRVHHCPFASREHPASDLRRSDRRPLVEFDRARSSRCRTPDHAVTQKAANARCRLMLSGHDFHSLRAPCHRRSILQRSLPGVLSISGNGYAARCMHASLPQSLSIPVARHRPSKNGGPALNGACALRLRGYGIGVPSPEGPSERCSRHSEASPGPRLVIGRRTLPAGYVLPGRFQTRPAGNPTSWKTWRTRHDSNVRPSPSEYESQAGG
jgi:hypothetical protein